MTTQTFIYTGADQSFTVPPNVTQITFDAIGAGGGTGANADGSSLGTAGTGGEVTGTMGVSPGQVLNIVVAGQGTIGNTTSSVSGGFGGTTVSAAGGSGGFVRGGGGGGASHIDFGTTVLVMAGGGGGAVGVDGSIGGNGGPAPAGDGNSTGSAQNGFGGQTNGVGGAGGNGANPGSTPGTSGGTVPVYTGGDGGSGGLEYPSGGGGGGGGYGGGGGGGGNGLAINPGAAGGGGANGAPGSLLNPVTDVKSTGSMNSGNGSVTITYRTVILPSLTTMVTPVQGLLYYDTAILSNGTSPTGTITFSVYGPGDTTCSIPIPLPSMMVTVSGNGSYQSPTFTLPNIPGTYQVVASYSGDTNNAAVSTLCGSEPIVVSPCPPKKKCKCKCKCKKRNDWFCCC